MKRTCKECDFCQGGKCHRFPRIGNGFMSDYPVVFQTDWCGEFKPHDIEPKLPQEVAEPQEQPQPQPPKEKKDGKAVNSKKR